LPQSKLFAFDWASGSRISSIQRAQPVADELRLPAAAQAPQSGSRSGVVGSLDYKIIEAGRADDLFQWLKDNKYHYAGDEASLNFYVQKKWLFTVMKIDTMQMKRTRTAPSPAK
jgi:hypothetical protein